MVSHHFLNRIRTNWKLVDRAHRCGDTIADVSRQELLERYRGAAWRYLRAMTREEALAEELFQEFALRLLRGDFRRAAPDKGRFRDYLKSVLVNLVKDHYRQRGSQPLALSHDVAIPMEGGSQREADDDFFLASWREELLVRTWARLEARHRTLHAVLLTHVQNPDATATVKSRLVKTQLRSEFSANRYRVSLHRARERFAKLLCQEVEQSLDNPTEDELRCELTQLGLRRYCSAARL